MNDQIARWIGIIIAIVVTAVVNRILNDKKLQALEDKLIAYFEAQLAILDIPVAEAKSMVDAIRNGEKPPNP